MKRYTVAIITGHLGKEKSSEQTHIVTLQDLQSPSAFEIHKAIRKQHKIKGDFAVRSITQIAKDQITNRTIYEALSSTDLGCTSHLHQGRNCLAIPLPRESTSAFAAISLASTIIENDLCECEPAEVL